MSRFKILCEAIICMMLFCGCGREKTTVETIGDLAYDGGNSVNNTVYIKEENRYVPFLVLTNHYEEKGNALLLRQYFLEPAMSMNECAEDETVYEEIEYPTSYYPQTTVDSFLNGEYLEKLSIKEQIRLSDILITDKDGTDTETIQRKVFLLSASETDNFHKYSMFEEGTRLKYFKKTEHQKGYSESGEGSNWWLRTKEVSYPNIIFTIGFEQSLGMADVNNATNYVRPAFCVEKNMQLSIKEIEGKQVYVLEY